ncbi:MULTISPECIES: NADH-quinone oxidoreductase subunit NuoH [Aneurinibacillus]|jgi:NADH-quinone oxidoreductase subunit H|uniref:NADH-quinone oxidoreductase subunit H n=1 Tax=Aneurinibacillus thermoaerophilus TaxID=143495 RepID=A0A1G8A0G5_ANETH|nr:MULTISPECIES: NADH-quinone oxidoreductase subunit NuoH [Aneurinibacillus]AMA71649.1 NADH:ubiquinone oxidoreductase subunit H [Aneurinibacillus sp. XH2]MED0676096.1 NADH-quinone oxidoreductase subunit NuoH [Aneurinibacillus thermoaerophilus]MED0680804.1 NADH-quinone oxidoreductase subunit NuoH [Aneurinibacillus thermoaerophilus]MED0738361.1 NADH-quinone oxidoreductase subunit NuoH [Aneurinibacillus thermoaerophilus]MED0757633.1 NADH-quinone oxidoreductase subunit NuoH [Aneurinibacillus therm
MGAYLEQSLGWQNGFIFVLSAVILLAIVLGFVTYSIYFQRKILGWMQLRIGPNRVGPFGLLQTVADVLKLLLKEDIIPKAADKPLFILAPVLAFMPAFAVLAVMPFTESLHFADLGVGLLYYIAISGITVLGVVTGGWASNNKWALIGAMRSAAQMISYEIPLVLSVVGVILMTGSLNLIDIVEKQKEMGMWFFIPQFLGFVIFIIAQLAELSRTPFDLTEAESELISGYHVEYSGFRWAFFMLAEYVYIFAMASLTTVLFLGGWLPPFEFLGFIPGIVWFAIKFCAIVFFIFWLQATFPRMRVDQLMQMGWKVLLPLALVNILITAVLKTVL